MIKVALIIVAVVVFIGAVVVIGEFLHDLIVRDDEGPWSNQ